MVEAYISAQFTWAACSTGRWTGTGDRRGCRHRPQQLQLRPAGVGIRDRNPHAPAPDAGRDRWPTRPTQPAPSCTATSSPTGWGAQRRRGSTWPSGKRWCFAGVDRSFEGRLRNPLSLSLLENAYGLGQESNCMLGAGPSWRIAGRATAAGPARAGRPAPTRDRGSPTRNPDRWALTLTAFGPLGQRPGMARAVHPGLQPGVPDHRSRVPGLHRRGRRHRPQLRRQRPGSRSPHRPGDRSWLLTPELTLLRQGEGRSTTPIRHRAARSWGTRRSSSSATVERTWRAALGRERRLPGASDRGATLGFHHIVNADHVAGRTRQPLRRAAAGDGRV